MSRTDPSQAAVQRDSQSASALSLGVGEPRRRLLAPSLLLLGFVAASMTWALAARSLLVEGHHQEDEKVLKQAVSMFDYRLAQLEGRVRSVCWMIGDDPRLRSALATQGIDEPTILDLLNEMRRPTEADLIAVLDPQGRVQAVIGDDSLAGADLSTSRFVRSARDADKPITGHWTLGNNVFSVGTYAVRIRERVIAYVIHGYKVNESALAEVESATGTAMALVLGNKVAARAPRDSKQGPSDEAFLQLARGGANDIVHVQDGAQELVGEARPVEGSLPPAYLVWLRPPGQLVPEYEFLKHLVWAPVLLCTAIALLFAHRLLTSRQ